MVRCPSYKELAVNVGDAFVPLETQIEEIEEIFEEFMTTEEGGSAVIFGPRFSGKRSAINKVIEKYHNSLEIKCVDGLLCSTDVSASRFSNIEETSAPKMIVLFDFHQFILRQNQLFLYTVLNATRNHPVFALCSTSRLDYMDLLENRVRSRLLNKVISFSMKPSSFSDFCETLRYFLLFGGKNTNSLVNTFLQHPKILEVAKKIFYDKGCSFAVLKQILAVFYTFLDVENINSLKDERCINIFIEATNTVAPTEDLMNVIFESLTLRQVCLLASCVHIAYKKRCQTFSYSEIASNFKLFVKRNFPLLYTMDNTILYKELDALGSLGLIEVTSHAGQQAYKKTSLQMDIKDFENRLDLYPSLPTGFKKWLTDFE
uniref:Origin recognition complex subunit 4 n=1 Tax=Syphacia muris TaxID=451379 RepID=A0A0N5AGW4_9BILA